MDLGENSFRKPEWGNLPYPVIHTIAKSDLQNIKVYESYKYSMINLSARLRSKLCAWEVRNLIIQYNLYYSSFVNYHKALGKNNFKREIFENQKCFGFKSSLVRCFDGLLIGFLKIND